MDDALLVYLPSGTFEMGNDANTAEDVEKPAHTVNLDAYWIYRYEVTNAQYALCVRSGGCRDLVNSQFLHSTSYQQHPVVYVSWYDAADYCQWAGGRLPTEAEWENAARGPDGFLYPWGNNSPTNQLANYQGAGTVPVGSYPDGASDYGAQDMAGNVWEWVSDWFSRSYYNSGIVNNPTGPDDGINKVVRDGSWANMPYYLRTTNRDWIEPETTSHSRGFRCVIPE
jgi:formylglycine-generating enzyme required for sulfatase activity